MSVNKLPLPRFTRRILQKHPSQAYINGSNFHSIASTPLKVIVGGDVGTTTLSDVNLAGYGTDYFKNCILQFRANNLNATGTNETVGDTTIVSASDNAGKLTFAATLTGATITGDEFDLIPPFTANDRGVGTTFLYTCDFVEANTHFKTSHISVGGAATGWDTGGMAVATGAVFIKSIAFQGTGITDSATGLRLLTNDAAPGAIARNLFPTLTSINFSNILNGTNSAGGVGSAIPVGHILATTKKIGLASLGGSMAGTSLRVVLECVRNSVNASLTALTA